MFHVHNKYRVRTGRMGTDESAGNNGAFLYPTHDGQMIVIASDKGGWEHLSASLSHRCPTWDEMCILKKIFWDETDCVVQYHPPASQYVNNHPHCLHLWRCVDQPFPLPPKGFV